MSQFVYVTLFCQGSYHYMWVKEADISVLEELIVEGSEPTDLVPKTRFNAEANYWQYLTHRHGFLHAGFLVNIVLECPPEVAKWYARLLVIDRTQYVKSIHPQEYEKFLKGFNKHFYHVPLAKDQSLIPFKKKESSATLTKLEQAKEKFLTAQAAYEESSEYKQYVEYLGTGKRNEQKEFELSLLGAKSPTWKAVKQAEMTFRGCNDSCLNLNELLEAITLLEEQGYVCITGHTVEGYRNARPNAEDYKWIVVNKGYPSIETIEVCTTGEVRVNGVNGYILNRIFGNGASQLDAWASAVNNCPMSYKERKELKEALEKLL